MADHAPPDSATERIPANLRADSRSWTALALAVMLAGVSAGLAVSAGLLQIDNAATVGRSPFVQGFVAIIALAVGIGVICYGSILLALRWWVRPGAAITPAGVVVYNWRPLLVPWPMISAVTSLPRSGRGPCPGLTLVNGEVVPVRFAAKVALWAAPDGARFGRFDVTEVLGQARRDHEPAGRAAAPALHEPGPLPRRRELPGGMYSTPPARRLPWSWWAAPFLISFLGFGRIVTVPHYQEISLVQLLSAYSGLVLVIFLGVVVIWARWARAVAIGPDWIAWRPRLARRWRVVLAHELASIAPGIDVSRRGVARRRRRAGRNRSIGRPASSGPLAPADLDIALCRSDGRGIRLRPDELGDGTAAAVLMAVGSHPGLTDAARQRLTSHLPGYPVS